MKCDSGRTALALIGSALLLTACSDRSTAPTTLHVHQGPSSTRIANELNALRASHARYNDIANAVADGYVLGYRGAAAGCVARPAASGGGAMGYHYFDYSAMEDPAIDPMRPEVLVYHTGDDGQMKLGAVEWVVARSVWEAAGNTAPPTVYGQTLHILNPVLNWYLAHAWIYRHNPDGLWADFNPDVGCP